MSICAAATVSSSNAKYFRNKAAMTNDIPRRRTDRNVHAAKRKIMHDSEPSLIPLWLLILASNESRRKRRRSVSVRSGQRRTELHPTC